MMKQYDEHVHSHVLIAHPRVSGDDASFVHEAWEGPHGIVLHVGTHVWVVGSYMHEGHEDVKRVGDARSNGIDRLGTCILSVPAEWCTYLTDVEAEGVQMCMDADARLLSYAR